jgi:TP53 regulating kinase-like protein
LTFLGETTEAKLIYKGAEAEIYLQTWLGELAIRKSRMIKPYRIAALDESIRQARTAHEANMMQEVRRLGVPVPTIRHVDPDSSTIIMDYVNGPTLKEELSRLRTSEARSRCKTLGRLLGEMHEGGVVHGDMTISNVLSEQGKLFLIDFGLGGLSREIEDRGVDLLLLSRAIKSTHYAIHAPILKAVINGYSVSAGKKKTEEVAKKMREIERRGRYFERS